MAEGKMREVVYSIGENNADSDLFYFSKNTAPQSLFAHE